MLNSFLGNAMSLRARSARFLSISGDGLAATRPLV